ncbi:MAG: hypothetical protein V4543_10615 [Bacteroidota bacterium]
MKYITRFLAVFLLTASCSTADEKQESNNLAIADSAKNLKSSEDASDFGTTTDSHKIYPETKTTEIFDTVLAGRGVQITIKKKYLDTYVSKAYEMDGVNYTEKYRDSEIWLTIKEKNRIALDTIFRKEQFLQDADQEFSKIAIFGNYRHNGQK